MTYGYPVLKLILNSMNNRQNVKVEEQFFMPLEDVQEK